jgi:hypothetical protein
MKTGKELRIYDFENYNVIFGSVNNKHPKAIYINISAWSDPTNDKPIDYNKVIRDINKKIKQSLYNLFNSDKYNEFLKDRTIVDLDIRESGIKYGKRSFMNCEITLFIDSELQVNSEIMKTNLNTVTTLITNTIFEDNGYFKFYRKKK